MPTTNKSEQLRHSAKRLERYARRVRENIWRDDYVQALADAAELGEIARRFCLQLQAGLPAQPPAPPSLKENIKQSRHFV